MKNKKIESNKVGLRNWLIIIIIGFAGQMAWAIENMYLNSYISYLNFTAPVEQQFDYNLMIALTTALSAITATITTLIMGGVSDKLNRRKGFIAFGYMLWGVSTASFGLLNVNSAQTLLPISMAASMAAIMVIIVDCVMTFFGSTSNDAAFNSFVTKNIKDEHKGKVEGVLGILPLIAMLVIFVGLNGLTTKESGYRWDLFFYIVGGLVFIVGIIALFLLPREKNLPRSKEKYFSLLIEGFKPSTIKKNKELYVLLVIYFIFNVAIQVFFPYLLIYIEKTCGISNSGEGLLTPFAIVMAVALLLGSLFSVLICAGADKKGKEKSLIPTLLIVILGCVAMFFIKFFPEGLYRTLYACGAGLILILGYVSFPSILNSLVRIHIPKGKEGIFMGVRMIFVVALPMSIGPFIGSSLNKGFGNLYTGEYGVQDYLPTEWGYIVAIAIFALIFILLIYILRQARKRYMNENHGNLLNNKKIDIGEPDEMPFNTYPRPNLIRNSYKNLNGYWDFKMSEADELPETFDEKILVPYPVESPYSGIKRLVSPKDYMYYHRVIKVNDVDKYYKVLLYFQGVDQIADVYLNRKHVLHHVGGYTRFHINLSDYLENGEVDLIVKVKDLTDTSYHTRGKQTLNPNTCFYTSNSGIWKPVWLEVVPKDYIRYVKFDVKYDEKLVNVFVCTSSDIRKANVYIEGTQYQLSTNKWQSIKINNPHEWSFDDPYLYAVYVNYVKDNVTTYFGFRKFEARKGENRGFYLNDKKIILNGVLDQGYYFPNGLTPRSYDDYIYDIVNIKKLGYNCIRKHIKVEDDYFYYLCDKYGILVIQDIPNGGERYSVFNVVYPRLSIKLFNKESNINEKKLGRENVDGNILFVKECCDIMTYLNNHPCVIMYTIFNEGRGEFDPSGVYKEIRKYTNLPIDLTSGWYHSNKSDVYSVHAYTLQAKKRKDKLGRPYLLSEFGGYGYKVKRHSMYKGIFTHHIAYSKKELTAKVNGIYSKMNKLIQKGVLDGIIYTQLSDCEKEYNGLYTFDRDVLKIDPEVLEMTNAKIKSYK